MQSREQQEQQGHTPMASEAAGSLEEVTFGVWGHVPYLRKLQAKGD